jgi:hydrogenase maturation protein HypF
LKNEIPSILAVGGELKNTICLTKGKHAFLSQHVGDLENLESHKFFEEAIAHLQNVLEIRPEAIAYDLHPDYFSTRWALQQKLPLIGVQHHHAHIASCMAENHLDGKVIGFSLDGTGYGTDGEIWGGEVLIADYAGFERPAHLQYVPLPGGAAAVREPWRMAVSYLAHHFGRHFLKWKLPFLEEISQEKIDLLLQIIERRVNSPLTSSCGRLFDAVAAIAGVRNAVTFEAQAAIELEMAVEDSNCRDRGRSAEGAEFDDDGYPLVLAPQASKFVIGTRPLYEALVEDVLAKRPLGQISRKFHNGLIAIFLQIAIELRNQTSLSRVCLSGGTFNNLYLKQNLSDALSTAGFEVFNQHQVPAGDGGLSLGQALVAAAQAKS